MLPEDGVGDVSGDGDGDGDVSGGVSGGGDASGGLSGFSIASRVCCLRMGLVMGLVM